jgi:hypothetical protein
MQIGVFVTGAQAGAPGRSSFDRRRDDLFQGGRRQPTWLRVSAFADLPLNFADVAIYDARGRLLFKSRHATNSQGVFAAPVRALPRDFRVTVTWDGYREQTLERLSLGRFTLSADEQNFDPVHDIVYVNAASTLVSRVLDAYPQMPLHRARALVRSFLGMPRNASLGVALREGKYFRSKYFSAATFLEEARQHGGIDALLDILRSDLSAQPDSTHLFAPAPAGPLQGALSFVAENLAKGALSWAAGQGCGWVAQSAGITTPGATAEDIANLQEGLANLQSSVDELSKQIQALTTQIFAKLTQTQYNQIVVPALALAAQVNGVEDDLTFFAQGCPAIPETGALSADAISSDLCTSQKATILAELSDVTINLSFETLSTYVLDNSAVAFNGLIHLCSQSLGESLTFFRPADSTKLQNMFDYWDSVQTQAANLKVELLHLNGAQDNPGGVAQLTSFLGDANANPPTQGQFQDTRNREAQLMFPAVPTGTVLYTSDRTMWATDNPATTFPTCVFPPDCSRPYLDLRMRSAWHPAK